MKKLLAALLLSVLGACVPLVASAQTSTSTPPRPTCFLTASGNAPNPGATVNLQWRSTDASGGTITTIGSVGPSGVQGVIPLPPSTTYVGTFTGPGGTATCSITIGVGLGAGGTPGATFPNSGSQPASGGTGGSAPVGGSSGGPLVACGGAADCNLCTFSSTVQNVINFALGLSIPIAAAMFAFAGWLYFSNRGNPEQIKHAHKIFWTVLVGFIIALMGWLLVQTVLKVLAPGYAGWNTFQCTGNRPMLEKLNNVLTGTLGTPQAIQPVLPGGGSAFGTVCPDGSPPSVTETGNFCISSNGTVVPAADAVGPTSISNSEFAQLLQNACQTNGMDSNACAVAQRISLNESSGGQNCTTSNTGAVGCMQVLSTTACSLDSSIPGCSTCKNSARAGCADVAAYISDPQVNTNLGVQYINQLYQQYGGSCQLTAAGYFQGPGNVQKYGGVPPNATSYVNKACR